MASPEEILCFAREVALRFRPRQIILFGSYGYGTPTADSDVDVLVVMPYRGASHRQATAIRQAVNSDFPMDLLVRSPDEICDRLAMNDFFLREITTKGITLYDAADPRVGEKGRRRLQERFLAAASA